MPPDPQVISYKVGETGEISNAFSDSANTSVPVEVRAIGYVTLTKKVDNGEKWEGDTTFQ